MPIVDECMQFHLSYLPPETTKILNYQPVFSPSNPSNLFDFNLTPEKLDELNREFRRNHKQFFDNIGKATWTILPLAVNEHFTAVILHAKSKEMPGTNRGFRTVISSAAVIEPERNAGVEKFIWERLQEILTEKRGFTFKHSSPVKLWFPKQYDINTCGFRVYEIMRIMMMRISQSVAEEGLRDGYNPKYIWQDFSGMCLPIVPFTVFLINPPKSTTCLLRVIVLRLSIKAAPQLPFALEVTCWGMFTTLPSKAKGPALGKHHHRRCD